MKSLRVFATVMLVVALSATLVGCAEGHSTQEQVTEDVQEQVAKQDEVYNKTQPVPMFNYSLPRDLWIQFYKASTTSVVRTWSYPVNLEGEPIVELESIGYPIPMDTQLTNPLKIEDRYEGDVPIPQAEPNGLYTSPNTNATIIMTVDGAGKVAPVYSEPTVLCFPFPVEYDREKGMFVRVAGSESSISLDVNSK